MPRIKEETKLAIDIIDMLFHIMIRSVHKHSADHLCLFLDIKKDIDDMMGNAYCDEYEKILLQFYSICFFQINVMASSPGGIENLKINSLYIKGSNLSTDDFKNVEKFEAEFVCLKAKKILETEAIKKGIDIKKINLISDYISENYRSISLEMPNIFLVDLPIKIMLFSDFFCLPKLLSYFSKNDFFDCERVKKNYENESFTSILILSLYKEYNQAIASGISCIYQKKIQSERNSTVFIEGKEIEVSLLDIKFNTREIKYDLFKKAIKKIIDGEENLIEYKTFPLLYPPQSKLDIKKLMAYSVEGICFRIFLKQGRQYRIDKVISMIGGYYLYTGLDFLEDMEDLPIIHNSTIGRFQNSHENKSSSSVASGLMKKFGISVSPNVIYREYLSGKKGLYVDIPYKWVYMVNGENNIYGFGPFLSQVVSGSFEYMKE